MDMLVFRVMPGVLVFGLLGPGLARFQTTAKTDQQSNNAPRFPTFHHRKRGRVRPELNDFYADASATQAEDLFALLTQTHERLHCNGLRGHGTEEAEGPAGLQHVRLRSPQVGLHRSLHRRDCQLETYGPPRVSSSAALNQASLAETCNKGNKMTKRKAKDEDPATIRVSVSKNGPRPKRAD
ncbi:hypothetical protein B0T24DRAFT_587429 [Lasiosphaeria ovina]|uniref:Uncharacterized protein n=1 Tax=Lasiosphaeria ovina TaxID=92902 RepID=A0AAE0NJH8_9PEZI|nr:hypothetical protein B0T24DRAFT_587429 [Lasiosphaeria ovina]